MLIRLWFSLPNVFPLSWFANGVLTFWLEWSDIIDLPTGDLLSLAGLWLQTYASPIPVDKVWRDVWRRLPCVVCWRKSASYYPEFESFAVHLWYMMVSTAYYLSWVICHPSLVSYMLCVYRGGSPVACELTTDCLLPPESPCGVLVASLPSSSINSPYLVENRRV